MAIPDFQSLMLPLLKLAADAQEHAIREAETKLSAEFGLSVEERAKLLLSGQTVFYNRVSWAKVDLQQAGLLASPRRGCFRLSESGRQVLSNPPERITIKFLETFPEFLEFRASRKDKDRSSEKEADNSDQETPEEKLEEAYQRIRAGLVPRFRSSLEHCTASAQGKAFF